MFEAVETAVGKTVEANGESAIPVNENGKRDMGDSFSIHSRSYVKTERERCRGESGSNGVERDHGSV